jgi:hypothetical protein
MAASITNVACALSSSEGSEKREMDKKIRESHMFEMQILR